MAWQEMYCAFELFSRSKMHGKSNTLVLARIQGITVAILRRVYRRNKTPENLLPNINYAFERPNCQTNGFL